MSEKVPIPACGSLSERELREVRWLESAFVEANYTVEYAKYIHHQRLVRILSKVLRPKAEATVVDLGCGDGCNLFALHRRLAKEHIRYIGVDLAEEALRRAANRIACRTYGNFELLCADVTKTGLPPVSADVVFSSEVAEHLVHPRLLFEEILRILKPGGIAVVTTPNLSNYPRRAGDVIDRLVKGRLREQAYAGMIERTATSGFTLQDGILGHVSEQPAFAWRKLAHEVGFQVTLLRGGTLTYGYPWLARHPLLFGLLCIIDSFLEFLPRWYDTSHDLLIVLRKGAS